MNNNKGTGTKIKVKCYYTDYVNHMIRFYLSTPEGLNLQERQYSNASINNWSAVQLVFHRLDPVDTELVRAVFGMDHYLPRAVEGYCKKNNADPDEVWKVITRVNAKIARVRGLM